ncbi:hypothetical protein PR048_003748 [Dryococelus australis]|uniref:Uncharacterized protein n=1 Tax=Dryococelus australis TaxID=614101 RepID=A0ABQ9IQL9_9NEOP|nr:hypothetical protein PR048_003748 [Dryococelus australis]
MSLEKDKTYKDWELSGSENEDKSQFNLGKFIKCSKHGRIARLSESVYSRCKIRGTHFQSLGQSVELYTSTDNKLELLGSLEVDFEIGDLVCSHKCVICEHKIQLNADGLLGLDFLRTFDCDISVADHILKIGNCSLHLSERSVTGIADIIFQGARIKYSFRKGRITFSQSMEDDMDTGFEVGNFKSNDSNGRSQPSFAGGAQLLAELKVMACNLERVLSVNSDSVCKTRCPCEVIPQFNDGGKVHVSPALGAKNRVQSNGGASRGFKESSLKSSTIINVSGLILVCREESFPPFNEILCNGRVLAEAKTLAGGRARSTSLEDSFLGCYGSDGVVLPSNGSCEPAVGRFLLKRAEELILSQFVVINPSGSIFSYCDRRCEFAVSLS